MDPSDVSGSRRRALLGLAALVLLLVVVAVASTGSVPGSGGTRRPSDRFLDVLISLFLLMMAFGVLLWGYILLIIRKDVVTEAAADRRNRSPWASAVRFALGFGLLALFVRWLSVDDGLRRRIAGRIGSRPASPAGDIARAPADYRPEFATGPVLVVLALLAVAVAAWYLSYRARRRRLEPMSGSLLPALADVLEETLDDLRAEAEPRRAVIAAYARMERALGAYGLPRNPAEAPDEYLQRIFSDLDVSRRATSRLTALFSWAKFSSHDVAPEMKQEAIDALEAVREELRAAEILAEHQRALAQAELRERAAR
jgi:hypothetical protein